MARIARARKAVATVVGTAIMLVLLVPAEQVPEQWRPWVGLLLAAGTVLGVYGVRNQQPKTIAPTLLADRQVRGGYESGDTPASELRPPPSGVRHDPPPQPRE